MVYPQFSMMYLKIVPGALPQIITPPQRPFKLGSNDVPFNSPICILSISEVNIMGCVGVPSE